MSYIPTEEELIELGFTKVAPDRWSHHDSGLYFHAECNVWSTGDWARDIYPVSKEDVLTLIRLFTCTTI